MNFEHIMFTNNIVLKPGTLGVCKQNTFRCSISVTIFSVLIWDVFFTVSIGLDSTGIWTYRCCLQLIAKVHDINMLSTVQ